MWVILLIVGLILFISLVVIHEFGHFIAARRNGVEVEEFGIGFPPRAWKKHIRSKKGDYYFSLNWLPLGGFVRLKGENDDADEPGSFGAASLSAKVKVMVAGVLMNLVAAFVLFTAVAWLGMPRLPEVAVPNQFTVASDEHSVTEPTNEDVVLVGRVVEDSPAAAAELVEGDELIAINDVELTHPEEVLEVAKANAGQAVELTVRTEAGETRRVSTELNSHEIAAKKGYLGIAPISGQEGFRTVRYTWSAPIVAAGTVGQFTQLTFVGLGEAASGFGQYLFSFITGDQVSRQENQDQASEQVTGPVGIFVMLAAVSQEGVALMLFVIALISLALAIMNILPIPALDGGRLFVTLLFRAIKKPLSKPLEEKIHATGFMVLMALFVLITIVDVRRFF